MTSLPPSAEQVLPPDGFLFREYRRLATGLSFLLFLLGGLALQITVFPLLFILPINRKRKRNAALAVVQWAFRRFTQIMCLIGLLRRFEVEGLHHFKQGGPYLVIANHPSLVDVVALVGMLPGCNCVVKKALWRNPFMGIGLRLAGFIPNDHAVDLMESCRRSFEEQGRSLMIFPEGTRSPRGGLGKFNRGAAQIAARLGVPVLPVVVTCDPPTLLKGEPWYKIPHRAVNLKLSFQPPLHVPQEVWAETCIPRRVRALNRCFENFYRQQLNLPQQTSSRAEAVGRSQTG